MSNEKVSAFCNLQIYNAFSRPLARPLEVGSKVKPVMGLKLNDRLKKVPYVVREIDIKEYINSFRDSCDMKVIISRYLNGDPNIKMASNYGDVSNVGDLRNALDLHHKVQSIYDNLSSDIKGDLSYNDFVSVFGSDDGIKALVDSYVNKIKTKEEVKNES